MTIIENYLPLNSPEKIKSLIDELCKIHGAMNPTVRSEIFQNIKGKKLQMHFLQEYPVSKFPCSGKFIPEAKVEESPNPKMPGDDDINNPIIESYIKKLSYLPADTLREKKSVYGTYIEMAFHNLYLTMHHIYALVFGEDLLKVAETHYDANKTNPNARFDGDFANRPSLWDPMFERMRNARPEQKEYLEDLFRKHFPFLAAIDALKPEKRESRLAVIERFSKVLRELRNCYSHYLFSPFANQIKDYKDNIVYIYGLMDQLYVGARREVKSRFAFSDLEMDCADPYKTNTDKSKKDKDGKMVKIVRKSNFRYDFFTIDKTNKEKVITPFGLVFLSSLFLEKKYSKIMTDKTKVIRNTDQKVMCELISVYRIRLHIQKLAVTKSTDALAFDIINELQRCPKTLFEMLQPAEQQKFRIKPESTQDPEVLMVRHSDRFAHLLLKYIDDAKLFDKLRFQVSLGRYFFKFYEKRCIDDAGSPRVRAICKDVNGFGRITEIEELRKSEWANLIRDFDNIHANTANEERYVTDHRAQYLIANNKVGIYVRTDDDKTNILPELGDDGARNPSPTCWLSCYELPALAFLLHLYNGDGARVEDIIRSRVGYYQSLFADVRDGKVTPVASEADLVELLKNYGGIKPVDLPRKMLDYLLMREVSAYDKFVAWAQSYIGSLIDECDMRKERIEKAIKDSNSIKDNKFGKKSFVAIKSGKIADFLAHDMMLFQPFTTERRNKLTGLNFRILQSSLATYNGNYAELRSVLMAAHIVGNAGDDLCNPIVQAVDRAKRKCYSLTDFYKLYLDERKKYLQKCLNDGNYQKLSFLHSTQTRWQERNQDYYRHLAARYLADEYGGTMSLKAIDLPRGLFEKPIREELSGMKSMKALANDTTKNMAYLIYGYFKQVIGDDAQTFYSAERCYQLFNLLYRKDPKKDAPVYYTAAKIRDMLMNGSKGALRSAIAEHVRNQNPNDRDNEKERCNALLRKIKNTETELKVYRTQDMLLFLIAKRILLNSKVDTDSKVKFKAIENIRLHDITAGDVFSQKVPIKVTVMTKNGYKKVLRQDDLKLKNYSQFYAVISDRRLPSLLDLVQEREVNRGVLEQELDNYDKEHPGVLKTIFEFERNYINTHDVSNGVPHLKDMLDQGTSLSVKEKDDIRQVRNSFAHLIYPEYRVADVKNVDMPQKAKTISNRFINKLK